MNKPAIKVFVAVVLPVGVFATFIARYPFLFALGWPSIALARVGVPHSWVFSAILLVGGVVWLGFWSRRRAWSRVVIASLAIPASYCALAFLFVQRASVPLPEITRYDSMPEQRADYLAAYDSGYRDGMIGFMRTYCFYSEVETRGFEDGAYQGSTVWYRMFGRRMPERTKRRHENSATTDGIKSESK